jgi:hypothetical protein
MSDAAKPTKTRYKTRNWAQYNAALKARGSLTIWLDREPVPDYSTLSRRQKTLQGAAALPS